MRFAHPFVVAPAHFGKSAVKNAVSPLFNAHKLNYFDFVFDSLTFGV